MLEDQVQHIDQPVDYLHIHTLAAISENDPLGAEELEDYRVSHGRIFSRVHHLLHQPHKEYYLQRHSSFDLNTDSLRFTTTTLRPLRDKHSDLDHWCKRMNIAPLGIRLIDVKLWRSNT